MISRSAEHIHMALDAGSCLLLMTAWGLFRHKYRQKEYASREDSQAHEVQLHQKDLVIREIHHRVANQMGLTAALLHLQASRSVHPDAKAYLFESENRIRTLADLHTRLHQTDPQCRISLYPYLTELARDLIASLRPDLLYYQEFSGASPSTPSTTTITCGLMVHELITNCIKHAFPFQRSGTIHLSLHCHPYHRLEISILDNGVGLPPGFTLVTPTTSGMAIVSALAKDLNGTFTATPLNPGKKFTVSFPLSESEILPYE